MRTTRTRKTAIATLAFAVLAAGGHAANVPDPTSRITLAEASRLTLKGKSTMHDFSSNATRLQLAVDLADTVPAGGSTIARLAAPGAVKSIVLTIPVEGLKSEKGDGLDKNMYKALKASANPNIVFRLRGATAAAGPGEFRVEGDLEVAGQTQPIDMTVRASECPEGIALEGSKALLMSSFGIKPPSMFLGTLKTSDQIVIEWRLVLNHNGF